MNVQVNFKDWYPLFIIPSLIHVLDKMYNICNVHVRMYIYIYIYIYYIGDIIQTGYIIQTGFIIQNGYIHTGFSF